MKTAASQSGLPKGGPGHGLPADPSYADRRPVAPEEKKERDELLKLWLQLDTEYTQGGWLDTHADIIDFIQPNRGAFWPGETNRGTRKDFRVVNNTAQDASSKLSAAMDTGITSEAREWFTVSVEDQQAAEDYGVREYCHEVQEALYALISRVGFYAPNRNVLEDLVGPGIGLMLIEEDQKNVARCTHVPVGQYRAGCDSAGEVNLVARRFNYSARQMAEEFGAENCSESVRSALRQQTTETTKYTVVHIIRERRDRQLGKLDAKNMPWESVWVELGMGYTAVSAANLGEVVDAIGPSGILRKSGFNERPFYCPRWNQIGQNAYGTDSPGWKAIGDTKSLQDLEVGEATTLAQIMDPALNVPDGLKNASLLPGARNPMPDNAKGVKAEATVEIKPEAVQVFETIVARYEHRITRAMYGDILFLLSSDPRNEARTAEEIRGKKEERLLQLGGVFARVARELRMAIKRFYAMGARAGLFSPAPQSLTRRGLKLKIEFVNPLITAQKALGFTAIQQVINVAIQLGEAKKAGADKLDDDEILDTAADMLGAKPNILLSDDQLRQKRAIAAQQAQAAQTAKSLPEAAGAINDLSNTDPDKLQSLLQRFGPNAQAQGVGS